MTNSSISNYTGPIHLFQECIYLCVCMCERVGGGSTPVRSSIL